MMNMAGVKIVHLIHIRNMRLASFPYKLGQFLLLLICLIGGENNTFEKKYIKWKFNDDNIHQRNILIPTYCWQ